MSEAPPKGPYRAARWPAFLFVVHVLCTLYFLGDVIWDLATEGLTGHDIVEVFVVIALVIGTVFGAREVIRILERERRMAEQLRAASGALAELIEEQFERWALTPAERDVALMAIKGLGVAETARLRGTADGTVKAQLNAIYTKAGVTGRNQLISYFIEELLAGPLVTNDASA